MFSPSELIITRLANPSYPLQALVAEASPPTKRPSPTPFASALPGDKAMHNDTPGCTFFPDLWSRPLNLAEEHPTTHDRLIGFIKGVKSSRRWRIHRVVDFHLPLPEHEATPPIVLFILEGGRIEDMDEAVTIASKTRDSYLNTQRFLVRLWADAGIDATLFADRLIRAAIRKGSSPHSASDEDDGVNEHSEGDEEVVSMAFASGRPSTLTLTIDDVSFSSDSDASGDEYDPASASDPEEDDNAVSDISASALSETSRSYS